MAWKEQCQIAFKCNADALIHKQGGKGIVKVLRQLCKESGIPYETLKRWYYGENKTVVKNDNSGADRPLCQICETRVAERKKKPEGGYWYSDICTLCRKGDEIVRIECPHCRQKFMIKKKEAL